MNTAIKLLLFLAAVWTSVLTLFTFVAPYVQLDNVISGSQLQNQDIKIAVMNTLKVVNGWYALHFLIISAFLWVVLLMFTRTLKNASN
jgi:hypothetical protein